MNIAPDDDVIVVRRVLAAAKMHKSRKNPKMDHWILGKFDHTDYFQAALRELKQCKRLGLMK